VQAAKDIINELKKNHYLAPIIDATESMCQAYIQLAYKDVSQLKSKAATVVPFFNVLFLGACSFSC